MMHEEAYKVQYLYNAVNEYLYFIIVYIEVYGPQNLNGLAKYVKFFKKEFLSFIEIFKGENQVKSISNLLCTATTAFYVKEETVHLSESYNSFKKVIHEDFIKSKVVDLVLRGISSVQDIYKNINLNNVINMREDVFLDMLNNFPYFHVETDSSVTVLQFHGLIGFDDYVYKTIAEYFESYLQKVDALTYDEINLHSRFIPSCGVQNSLVIFCVFYIGDVFKIKNNKVRIRKNWKIKPENQQRIDIDQLSSRCQDDVSVSRLVFIAHGPYLQNWTGEIVHLNKSIGFIQCVIDFKGNCQGVFSVYFNFTALKFVCDTENLENFLNIRDTVEFDAEFCDKTAMKDRYWKALQVTVTKQGLRRNKYKLRVDTEEYRESIQFKNKLNPSLKSYLENNQCIRSWPHDINGHNSEQLSRCTGNFSNIPFNFSNGIISLHPAQTVTHDVESKPIEVFSDQVSTSSYSSESTVDKSKEPPLTQYLAHNDSSQPNEMSSMKNKIFEKINAPLENDDKIPTAAYVTNFKQHIQEISKEMLQNNEKGLHKNRMLIANFPFSHSNFIFGEIVIITNNEGIAISLNPDRECEVFFKTQAIFQQDVKYSPKEGSKVLLFIPHYSKECTLCVATLVYALDNEESVLVSENYEWVQDFVIDYFFPKLKMSIFDLNTCNCDLSKGLFFESMPKVIPSKYRETVIKFDKYLMDLKEVYEFDEKTVNNFQTAVKIICSNNLEMSEMKLFACIMSQLFKSIPCYRKFEISCASRSNESVSCKSSQRNFCQLLPPHLIGKRVKSNRLNKNSLSLKNKSLELQSSNTKKVKFESKNYSGLTLLGLKEYYKSMCVIEQDALESGHASCSSISSYVSCNSKSSSDEVFHSCDSLSGKPTSDSEADFNSDSSQIDYQTDSIHDETVLGREENASSPEIFSYSDATDKFVEIQVTDTDKEELSPQDYEKIKFGNQDKKCLKFKYISSFKRTNKKKWRITVGSQNNCCKCQKQLIETTACISTITNSCLLLSAKNNEQNITLSFPKCLIPNEVWTSMKLNTILKIAIVPHALIQLSRILYIEFFPT